MNLPRLSARLTTTAVVTAGAIAFCANIGALPARAQTNSQIVAASPIGTWNPKDPLQRNTINTLWGPFGNGGNDCVAQPPFTANACPGIEVRVDGIAVPVQYFGPGDGPFYGHFKRRTSRTT